MPPLKLIAGRRKRAVGHPSRAFSAHGVPALAGRVLLLEGGPILREISGKTASDRLKPGLHALWASAAYEICGLRLPHTLLHQPIIPRPRIDARQHIRRPDTARRGSRWIIRQFGKLSHR